MSTYLRYEQDGAVVTLTLNRPDIRNALIGLEDGDEIVDACQRITRDMSVRAVILTGAGTAFSAGGDIKRMGEVMAAGAAWTCRYPPCLPYRHPAHSAGAVQPRGSDHRRSQRCGHRRGV